ncbi:hypothetical protein ASZ90_002508 [hydrocarbon metagenome]|uniref:Uncharacterized protein n=1 Tax=hydrocarbon metagenome TaxID=938273 RepID=A0A0W8G3N9_9ZZZZ
MAVSIPRRPPGCVRLECAWPHCAGPQYVRQAGVGPESARKALAGRPYRHVSC